ncbi:TetR family transcriptional regulator C-terminal domain-containing protein [Fulvivirgaceae bacterium BMA12]|uniref:TetR family transcriptional regulator C-terminal domain-containing protein n=1 Tax=Agaribacillus aureus TaxID=3051825 RepID=A0ABT8L0D2_9BACT|nr:TetR family transcriptional regulator C-terminal domain-containing protein [Fulvivirgaceae bacterium BMA12]
MKEETPVDIEGAYMKYVLERGDRPKSIYSFAQDLGIKESEFYDQFGSFEAVEKAIFKAFFDHTKALLDKNKEFQTFDARNKLISFYYTFFEVLKANRSYVVFSFEAEKNKLKLLSTLSELKKAFGKFIREIGIETIDFKEEKMEKFKNQGLHEGAWAQLLFTIKFWLEDSSKGFEKTDIFIEKSITTSFAVLDNSAIKSVLDLGKFLFKEKVMKN